MVIQLCFLCCRIPRNKVPILKYRPTILFFATVLFSMGVVIWWAVERHSGYAWILQDLLGFAFISMLLSRLRFLKVWFVAVLMMLLFLYDIFMVFITPYFTNVCTVPVTFCFQQLCIESLIPIIGSKYRNK